jgi:hypothetical protein
VKITEILADRLLSTHFGRLVIAGTRYKRRATLSRIIPNFALYSLKVMKIKTLRICLPVVASCLVFYGCTAKLRDDYTGYAEVVFTDTGDKYKGEFVDGKFHGVGIFNFSSGLVYRGQFFKGEMQGVGIYEWVSGTSYSGRIKKGMLNGTGILTAPDGSE